jgi:putative ABC transport system permease protein
MRVLAVLRMSFWALGRNKMRSALTMLGIIIGVGAVISLVSIGEGARGLVEAQLQSIGTNIMYVSPRSIRGEGGARGSAGQQGTLTAADVAAIRRDVPVIEAASPIVTSTGQLIFKNRNRWAQVQGVNEEMPAVRDWAVEEGVFFSAEDVARNQRVIVIGPDIAEELFEGLDPIGQTVRLRDQPFRVIGVLESKGQSSVGQNQDEAVLMPYTTVQRKLLGQTLPRVNQAVIKVINPEAMSVAERLIEELLRERHHLEEGAEADFGITNLSEISESARQITLILTLTLGSIAGISLFVGGIGIMNIMLVSVTERTREIGIRMAVGSRPVYIRLQFLAESVIMSITGGLIGILIGGALAMLIGFAIGFDTTVSIESVSISFGFATAVGVFFGFYPAHKAASMEAIDALRYE